MITGPPSETMPKLKEIIEQLNPAKIITVGDVVTAEAQAAGIPVTLGIIDGKTMRRGYAPAISRTQVTFHVVNPAGMITKESWRTIKEAMNKEKATIIVDGEEDLLALPAVVEAPLGALIVYGQPSRGIVVVEATSEKKAKLTKLVKEFRRDGPQSQ